MYTAILENWILEWGGEISIPQTKTSSGLNYNNAIVELLELCKTGDRVAQQKLYEKLFGKMMSICRRYIKNNDDAIEVLNTGFLKVFKNIRKYEGKGSFEGWVSKIIINSALDHLRSSKNYSASIVLDADFESKYDSPINIKDYSGIDPEVLYAMIDSLPEMSKAVFNMFAIDGYSHKEVSKKLNISTGTSKWHVSYSRQKLKEMLIKEKANRKLLNG